MQARIRQILDEQNGMLGGVVKKKCPKVGLSNNPWLDFLKFIERKYKIPYNEAMRDPKVKKMYKEFKLGSGGLLIGGYGTKEGAIHNPWDQYLEETHEDAFEGDSHPMQYEDFKNNGGYLKGSNEIMYEHIRKAVNKYFKNKSKTFKNNMVSSTVRQFVKDGRLKLSKMPPKSKLVEPLPRKRKTAKKKIEYVLKRVKK